MGDGEKGTTYAEQAQNTLDLVLEQLEANPDNAGKLQYEGTRMDGSAMTDSETGETIASDKVEALVLLALQLRGKAAVAWNGFIIFANTAEILQRDADIGPR